MRHKLVLKREALTALSSEALSGVVGGTHLCVTTNCGHGATFDTPCAIPTTPINNCPSLVPCIIGTR